MDIALRPPEGKKAPLRQNWPANYGPQRVTTGGGSGGGGGDASTLNGQPGSYYLNLENSTGHFDRGINWGSAVAGSPSDLSRHIALYSTTYGFSITSAQLNYNVNVNASHVFYGGGVEHFRIRTSAQVIEAWTDRSWEKTVSGQLFRTPNGYLEIGPFNTSFCHFRTDRSRNYFYQPILIVGHYAATADDATSAGTTTFDIGHTVAATADGGLGIPNRCASQPVRLSTGNSFEYTMQGAGSILSGTYRSRGLTNDSPAIMLMERVA